MRSEPCSCVEQEKKATRELDLKDKLDQKRKESEAKEYQEYIAIFETNLESIRSYF
jgi:hypothetical protein